GLPSSLISMLTSSARSSRMSESTAFGVGSTMSIRRLCVRISKCSRLSLYLCGERMTQYTFFSVGNGTGPTTVAPARVTVSTILRAALSITAWSYDLSRMRIFCPAMASSLSIVASGHQRAVRWERLPSVPADHDRPPSSGVSSVPVGEVLTSLRNADGAFTHWLLGPNPLMQIHRSDSVSGCSQYRYRSAGVNAQNATSLSRHIAPNARNFRHLACERYLRPCRACGPQARARPLRDCPSEHETGAAVPKDCGPCSGSSVSQIRR